MKRTHHLLAAVTLGTVLAAGLLAAPASAATTGTWAQYPSGAALYEAQVQQPIDSANTSNWSAKSKGAIPVKFQLKSGSGPAVFESILSDSDAANDYAFMSFTPDPGITFNDITTLKTDYAVTLGNCHGGSMRWSVRVSPTESVFIYYGDFPNFADCTTNSQSGVNMIGLGDLRYDTSQIVGGTFYDSYAHAQALVGTRQVIRASLVLDSGWAGDQRMTISNTTVNDNVHQWDAGGTGGLTRTCDLPDAQIQVTKIAGADPGPVNEQPVQGSLADSGNAFRTVDCMYMYNLSVPSLKGVGKYRVEVIIDGDPVPTSTSASGQVLFDLK
jgi:hypothetical protein